MSPVTSSPFDLETIAQPAAAVEAYMAEFLDQRPLPANLREAIRYAVLGGGKRLRPILVVRCCEAVGGCARDAMAAAAAVEMIHAFSLVHDDLPAMDDDDLRRGRPTLHKHTNEAMAILAGDALTALAFELISTRIGSADLASVITRELAIATSDMIGGQVYDTLGGFDAALDPVQRLRTTHRHKTAALIRGSCRMGAMCGGADAAQLDALTCYGEAIGLMFQVMDDLLDETQTTEQLGKAAGKDRHQGKLTYPGMMGIERSRAEVKRLHDAALGALEGIGPPAEHLRVLCGFLAVRQK